MSYILDALKKSEKQRKRGTVPDVLTVQEIVIREPSRAFRTSIVIVAIVLISGILAWLLGPWAVNGRVRATQTPPVVPSSHGETGKNASSKASSEKSAATESEMVPRPGTEARRKVKVESAGHPYTDAPPAEGEEPTKRVSPAGAADAKEQDGRKGLTTTHAETADLLPPAENRLYQLKELPEAVRKRLPNFNITAFLYSASSPSRMARINGRMMREGDELSSGIRLEEITAEGVVLKYQDYRFNVEVK